MVIDGGGDEVIMMMIMEINCSGGVQSVLPCCGSRHLVCKFVFMLLLYDQCNGNVKAKKF
jgi:hypothetical protein